MMSYQFGEFYQLCHDASLPVCNIFNASETSPGCQLQGFTVNNTTISNLGDMLAAFFAIIFTIFIIWRSFIKYAAVGRTEMILFFVIYILMLGTQIVSGGGFLPKGDNVLTWFTAANLGLISALSWILVMNAIVGFQLVEDGTLISVGGILLGGVLLFVGVGYIVLDTANNLTGTFTFNEREWKNIALFILYILLPLFSIAAYVVLETILVIWKLGERRPLAYLYASLLSFIIGQVFMFVISRHICEGTANEVDGSFFATLFVFLSVFLLFVYWSSITEDVWEDYDFTRPETPSADILPMTHPSNVPPPRMITQSTGTSFASATIIQPPPVTDISIATPSTSTSAEPTDYPSPTPYTEPPDPETPHTETPSTPIDYTSTSPTRLTAPPQAHLSRDITSGAET